MCLLRDALFGFRAMVFPFFFKFTNIELLLKMGFHWYSPERERESRPLFDLSFI